MLVLYTHTRILKPFEDSKPTVLKVKFHPYQTWAVDSPTAFLKGIIYSVSWVRVMNSLFSVVGQSNSLFSVTG